MLKKYAGVMVLGLLFVASQALAQVLTSVTAKVGCTCGSSTLSVKATGLTPGTNYTIVYSIAATPTSGSATAISSSITFTATASAETVKAIIPLGRLAVGTYSLSGNATLTSSGSTVPIAFSTSPLICPSTPPPPPPPACSARGSNSSNFNGTAIDAGSFIWFNANFSATGVPTAGASVTFTNSTISFSANGKTYLLAVPKSLIVFSSKATCSTVSFDTVNDQWDITVPVSGSDEIFLSGLSFPVPAGGLPGGVQNVTWSGTFGTNTPGLSFQWKWGAAVYSSFTTNYDSLDVKPTHSDACSYNNGDHAGTPESVTFQGDVVGGATGGGGSNFTGSWSGTGTVTPVCK